MSKLVLFQVQKSIQSSEVKSKDESEIVLYMLFHSTVLRKLWLSPLQMLPTIIAKMFTWLF